MSRRSRRRSGGDSSARGVKGSAVKWSGRIALILALIVVFLGFGVYSWMKSYLRSDEFRVFMGERIGSEMGGTAEFEPFVWLGMEAQTGGLKVQTPGVIQNMEADGMSARVSLDGVRRGVWEISDLRINALNVDFLTDPTRKLAGEEALGRSSLGGDSSTIKNKESGGFLKALLPDRAELMSAEVRHMNLNIQMLHGKVSFNDVAMRVDGGMGGKSYGFHLSDGSVEVPWVDAPLQLKSARGKYQNGRLFLMESQSKIYDRGVFTLNGELEKGEFGWFGSVRDVTCKEVVPENWKKSLMGNIEAKFKVSQVAGRGVVTRGEIELTQGVLTALPVLDRIAAYANTRRFRRLNLSESHLKFRKEAGRLELTDIVLASEGLVRVKGSMTIENGQLDGRFRVGITPGTLAHIPGAETKVFLRGEKGLLWSPLRITGTVDDPKEDLSQRMIAAAAERMFEIVPETGKKALKFAHETATELPVKVLEKGTDVIKNGGELIENGGGVIEDGVRGVLDLLPGG